MSDAVRAQYEAYPYPARDPRDEAKRLLTGSPSHLDELNHYVFGGRLDFSAPFRVLVAGGGTGDALIMLAQHCADAGVPAEIVYLDLSQASRATAEARAAARGLNSIRFVTGSLLEVATAAPGPYHYIDCCGVLHHLPEPAAGLAALAAQLGPGGGMGLMLYGPYGRTGVYPLQSALRRLGGGLAADEQVALARRLLAALPETNWFRRNPLLQDHKDSDAGLCDLLLHSQDRPFTVGEIETLVDEAGLAISGFVPPLRYDPAAYLGDGRLRARLEGLDALARAALAEELTGAIKTHAFYVVPRARLAEAVARPDDPAAVPVPRDIDGPALARKLKPGQGLSADLPGLTGRLPLPPLAAAMLARIDGRRDLATLHREIAGAGAGLSWDAFKRQFDQLYATLNGLGKLYLRR
ncbi:MAG: class I SAM-dependent methyltransferase [Inquilinus sp.]|nr:class I SAM-dependent methyltransferase [Inquilinus sp.]